VHIPRGGVMPLLPSFRKSHKTENPHHHTGKSI
jgi:hypothetical protein